MRQWRIAYVPQRMLSEGRFFLKAEFSRKPNFPKFPNCGFNTRHDNREVTLIKFFDSRICPTILSDYLRNVPKCELNTRHDNREVTLIHLTRAQTLRSDKCATGSIHANRSITINVIHANCSAAQVYVLHPGQFIFALKCRRRSFLQVLQSTERQERYFEKFFVYLMMTNVMMKTCLNHKIIKISNLIQAMKNSVCPKAKVIRRPNISERRSRFSEY